MEPRTHAEKQLSSKLRGQLHAALGTIETAYSSYEPPKHRGPKNLDEHMDWLFQRQRHRRSYAEIQGRLQQKRGEDGDEGEAVRKACKRLADAMGLVLYSPKSKA